MCVHACVYMCGDDARLYQCMRIHGEMESVLLAGGGVLHMGGHHACNCCANWISVDISIIRGNTCWSKLITVVVSYR